VNVIDPTSVFEQASGGQFVSGEEKQQLHAKQTPLYVIHAEANTEGNFGPQTVFHVKAKEWGKEETRLLAFGYTENRERLANGMLELLNANPGKPLGPIYLWKYTTKSGNEAWDIKPTPYQAPANERIKIPVAAAGSLDADDDLPF